jgi:hypothetical protein
MTIWLSLGGTVKTASILFSDFWSACKLDGGEKSSADSAKTARKPESSSLKSTA